MAMEMILKYFPSLSVEQRERFAALGALYREWNAKINVISRKDIDHLYEHHVLHSLSIAKVLRFRVGTRVLDFGTGGGFPGIPLAIMFPDIEFKLIDGTGKKIKVVTEIARSIGLENVTAEHRRGEDEKEKFDFIVTRAVMTLDGVYRLMRKNIGKRQRNSIPNGIIALKGGDVSGEIHNYRRQAEVDDIHRFFSEEWFIGKHIIYLPVS